MMDTEDTLTADSFACTSCGADLSYQPGTTTLVCKYCGAENEIPQFDGAIEEQDFLSVLNEKAGQEEKIVEFFVKCDSCGASCTLDPNVTASDCPYCSSPLVIEQAQNESVILPKSLLPFKLAKEEALIAFKGWVGKRWFAPNDLKKASLNFDHFKGVYIPYWTFDTDTDSSYIGQRGDHYYVNESYTTTEDGKSVTKTRRVQKTRWSFASGRVRKSFDDILIVASESLPKHCIEELEPWDLENLIPFEKSYLSGFVAEKYQVDLGSGFERAKGIADQEIRKLVRRDIGGDEQRISRVSTHHDDITFKHLLLPVFVCAYRFKDKLYRFLVNGRTGEVQGERPWSVMKIAALVLAVLAVVGIGAWFYMNSK
jgi:DNA-directed RNA polymerase subunit RPC12/RpoP